MGKQYRYLDVRARANRQAFELQPVVSRSWFAALTGPLGPRPRKSSRSHSEILCLFAGPLRVAVEVEDLGSGTVGHGDEHLVAAFGVGCRERTFSTTLDGPSATNSNLKFLDI